MNRLRTICLWCISFCALSVCAHGQSSGDLSNPLEPLAAPPRIYVGPIGGFNKNFHTGGFRSFVTDISCPSFGTGDASGFYGGGSLEYLLGDPKDSRMSFILRIAYDNRPANFKVAGDKQPSRLREADTTQLTIVETTSEHVAEIKFSMINMNLLYKLMIGHTRLAAVVGPSIGYALTASVQQKFQLTDHPELALVRDTTWEKLGYQYTNFDRTVIIRDGDIPDLNRLRIGMNIGLQYEFTVRKAIIVPIVMYDFGVTKLTSSENWRVNALQAGVDVRFAL